MYHDIIRSILNSDLKDREKLAKIGEIVDRVDSVERHAIEYASKRGRKPNWDDRLRAIQEIEKSKEIQPVRIDRSRLEELLSNGIPWLIETIRENGGWATSSGFEPYTVMKKPSEPVRPIDMLYVAPWEISLTIVVLSNWVSYFSQNDHEALELIKKGKGYLMRVQKFFKDGGLGDSIWFKGVHSTRTKSRTNTLETAIAIASWAQPNSRSPSEYFEAIQEATSYLKKNWNKKDGGWGFKNGWKSDVKSTSLVLMTLAGQLGGSQADDELRKMLDEALEWLLEKQNLKDGSWRDYMMGRDNAMYGSFFAIEALTMEKYYLEVLRNKQSGMHIKLYQEKIDLALSRALRWYESSQKFMKRRNFEGWGWQTQIEGSDIENTAAGVVVMLDAGWLGETSLLMANTLRWLFKQKDPDRFWYVDTPLVLLAFMRFLKPETRLYNTLKRRLLDSH